MALAQRAFARWALGQPGWRDDFDRAVATARVADPISYADVVNTHTSAAITCGLLLPDDAAVGEIDQALRAAERSADDVALGIARTALGVALLHRASEADRERGLELLEQLRDMCLHEVYYLSILHFGEVYIARERARRGDREGALPLLRSAVDGMFNTGHLGPFIPGTGVLVETLLARGGEDDVREAEAAIDRLASVRFDDHLAVRDIWLARLQMMMARAHGDEVPIGTIGIATAPWRHRWASRGTWSGPRRCHDGGRAFGGGDVSVHRCRGFDPSVGSRRRWDAGGAQHRDQAQTTPHRGGQRHRGRAPLVSVVGAAWLLMGQAGRHRDPLDRRRAATSMISGDWQWTSSHPYSEGGKER